MCYHCMRVGIEGGRCAICGAPVKADEDQYSLALPRGTLLDDGNVMLGEVLGSGGFGITYIARDKLHGRVALKEFAPRYMLAGRHGAQVSVQPDKRQPYEKSLRSFSREAHLLSELRHPNIVRVLFELEENGTAYYGMELLTGEDLADFIQRRGRLTAREAWSLLLPVVDALIYIHSKNTLHRDLSPDNIFLRRESFGRFGASPCLIDFGAAFTAMNDFTRTVPHVQKSGYSPLEQNWEIDRQGTFTDVYAFCATYYYAVTGCVPVPASARSPGSGDSLKPMRESNRDVPEAVERVIRRGMELVPRDRIQTMIQLRAEMTEAIGKCGGDLPDDAVRRRIQSRFAERPGKNR